MLCPWRKCIITEETENNACVHLENRKEITIRFGDCVGTQCPFYIKPKETLVESWCTRTKIGLEK